MSDVLENALRSCQVTWEEGQAKAKAAKAEFDSQMAEVRASTAESRRMVNESEADRAADRERTSRLEKADRGNEDEPITFEVRRRICRERVRPSWDR